MHPNGVLSICLSFSLVDLLPFSVSSCLLLRLCSPFRRRSSPPGVILYLASFLSLSLFLCGSFAHVACRPSWSFVCRRCVMLYFLSWRTLGYIVPYVSSLYSRPSPRHVRFICFVGLVSVPWFGPVRLSLVSFAFDPVWCPLR